MFGRRTLSGELLERGARVVSRMAQVAARDPRGQEALARAVGFAQRSRERLEAFQQRVMAAAGIPGRRDYEDLLRQLARIKRKARELSVRLAANGRSERTGADDEAR